MKNIESNISLLGKWGFRFLIIAFVIESIMHPALENLYGCFVILYAWFILNKFVLRLRNFEMAFLPTCALIGYVVCYFALPLFVTLLEGKPLTFNFAVPYLTFTNQFLNVTVIFFAYFCVLKCYKKNNAIALFWKKIGYFSIPKERTIWILGFWGTFCLFLNIGRQADDVELQANTSLLDQIVNLTQSFSVFPLSLFFPKFLGCNTKFKTQRYVIPYILILSLIGIATTRRALVFNSLATIGILFFLKTIIDNRKIVSLKMIIVGFFAFFIISGPFTDLATAMILNRKNLTSGSNTFEEVIRLYNNKEELHSLYNMFLLEKDNQGNNGLGWSEYYVDNIFLDRFCNIRVQDATLYYTEKIGYANNIMKKYFHENFINHLPGFIVDILGEKKTVITTPIDHMVGSRWDGAGIGSWRVGGDTGIGLATMGYMYYPFAFLVYFFLFYFLSTCVWNINRYMYIIPLPILATMMWYFNYFDNAIGIYRSINYLLASGWRSIIFYCIYIFVFNRIYSLFIKKGKV